MLRKLLSTPYALFHANVVSQSKSSCITNPLSCAAKLTSMCSTNVATYDEVKKAGSENKVLIIDVREPAELQETGVLPGSINIPLGEIESVLRDCSPEEFSKKYGREKPNKDSPIIFSCKAGKRGASALAISEQLGFKRAKNFGGGWLEWEKHS